VNKVLLSHAGRIESLHDQSQWIVGLETRLPMRDEVKKADGDIEAAVTGYRSSGGGGTLDELPKETVAVLRRPSQVIKEESEKLDKAKQEADEAKRALDGAVSQYEQVSRTKHLPDLNHAIQESGTKVSLLRKRIQIEERVDQLGRRRQELEVDSTDLGTSEEAPLRITALLGVFFSLGVMLILIGVFGGMYEWVGNSWLYVMFGIFTTGAPCWASCCWRRLPRKESPTTSGSSNSFAFNWPTPSASATSSMPSCPRAAARSTPACARRKSSSAIWNG
jgi:hypothetical protein